MNEQVNKRETASERFKRFWDANHKKNQIQNTNEFLKPEISDLHIVIDKSPYGTYTTLLIAIKNIPVYNQKVPRYAFFYSFEEVSADLDLIGQRPVFYPQVVIPRGKRGKFAEFYIQLYDEGKDFYLTVVDVIAEKVIYQTVVSHSTIERLRQAKRLSLRTSREFFQKKLQPITTADRLMIESYKNYNLDGEKKDYYSVSFACNNACNKENFKIVLTKFYKDESRNSFYKSIAFDEARTLDISKKVQILHKYVKNRRGYIVFSTPTVDKKKCPFYINVIDSFNGRFFARACTEFHFDDVLDDNFCEESIFNDHKIYQRWLKQHEALQVELVEQREAIFETPTKFSIVVTVDGKNVKYLEETVESVLSQTYRDYEVIVASSLSENCDYWGYLSDLENLDDKVKLLDGGEKSSRTTCYFEGGHYATGDYIVFLKSGDELTENALFEFKKKIDECENDVDLLYCDEDEITEKGFFHPSFNAWDVVARLTKNYNNSLFAVSRKAFAQVECQNSNIDGAENYYCMLQCKHSIAGVDKVLCHRHYIERTKEFDKNGLFVLNDYLHENDFPAKAKLSDYAGIYNLKWKKFSKNNHLVVIVNNCDVAVEDKIAEWDRCGWLYSLNTSNPRKILNCIQETCNGLTLYLENVLDIDLKELERFTREAYWGGGTVVPKLTKPSKLILNTGIITQGPEYIGYIDGGRFTFEEGLDYGLKHAKTEDCVFRNCMLLRGYDVKNMRLDKKKIVTPGFIMVDPTWDVTIFEDGTKDKRFVTESYIQMRCNNGGDNFLSWQLAENHVNAWRNPLNGQLFTNRFY